MERNGHKTRDEQAREFQQAASGRSGTMAGEVWSFLRENRKWWLLPLIVVLVLVGTLVVLSSTAVAPFIYTLF